MISCWTNQVADTSQDLGKVIFRMLLSTSKALARHRIPLVQESLLGKEHVVEHNLESKSFRKIYLSSDEAETGMTDPASICRGRPT